MLEQNGYLVSRMLLCALHPSRTDALVLEIPSMRAEIDLLAQDHADRFRSGNGERAPGGQEDVHSPDFTPPPEK